MTTMDQVLQVAIAAGVVLIAWAGVVLTAFTLPGIWIAIVAAVLAEWWWRSTQGGSLFSIWTLVACVVLAVIAEIAEFAASALGAAKMGGSKKAALASVLGAIVGAVVGTFALAFLPILGTIIGAAGGAGIAALLTEKHLGEKTWKDAGKVGAGAAAGRLAASLVKVAIAGLVAVILTIAALV